MAIVLDLVLATRPKASTGIERYSINLFKALQEITPDVVAFVDSRSNVLCGTGVIPVRGGFIGWLFLPFSRRYRELEFDSLICPAFPPSPFVLNGKTSIYRIIHDDFPWTRSRKMNFRGRLLFKYLESALSPFYHSICAPTEPVARSLAAILKRDVALVGNAPGLDLVDAPPADRGASQVITVGTIEPRKNYDAVMAMAPHLPTSWSVAIVGRKGWGKIADDWERYIDEEGGRLEWHGHASDETLLSLYQKSSCFLSMSLAEGFNMPLVEAGCLGLPVVCSDIEIHRAVAPPWARFAPLSIAAEDLANTVIQSSAELPSQEAVAEYRQRFSWREIARTVALIASGRPQ